MKKNYENYIIYGLLGLVILVLIFAVYGFLKTTGAPDKSNSINNEGEDTSKTFESINSGSTDSGDVSIELTPYEMNKKQLKVRIAANTHSVDLSGFDLKQITFLEYNGQTIKPISAPSLQGHHSNGELIFNIEKELSSFTIKIKGIPKVEERVFTWQI